MKLCRFDDDRMGVVAGEMVHDVTDMRDEMIAGASYAVLGPWMVTADEIPDPDDVRFSISVNGEIRQDATTADLIYNTRRLIAFASSFYTLLPGDLLYTGSPEGVGPVKPGDIMRAQCGSDRRDGDRGAGPPTMKPPASSAP